MRLLFALCAMTILGLVVAPDATWELLTIIGQAAQDAAPHALSLIQALIALLGRLLAGVLAMLSPPATV